MCGLRETGNRKWFNNSVVHCNPTNTMDLLSGELTVLRDKFTVLSKELTVLSDDLLWQVVNSLC